MTAETEDPQPLALPDSAPPIMSLLHLAVDKGVDVETLERLMTLHERLADRKASEEFAEAFAKFQSECPPIAKRSEADRYKYASLDQIASVVNPLLAKHGLSYTWDTDTSEGSIKIICHLRHVNGHTVQSHASMVLEQGRGINKNQSTGSAMSYGQRYSLIQVLGLTTCQSDDDGASSGNKGGKKPTPMKEPRPPTPMSTKAQRDKIMTMCRERGISDADRHSGMALRYKVESVHDLTQEQAGDMIERLAQIVPQKKEN